LVFYMPGQIETSDSDALEMTPRQIVEALDRHIVGQANAKRAVAVALRNRLRRKRLDPAFAEEVMPKNILMIGPTGVGKTEIARRLARLAGSPFLKVEASKFTEVGYVGRDVESMVRDLVEIGVDLVREERRVEVRRQAEEAVAGRLLDLLLPPRTRVAATADPEARARDKAEQESWERSRRSLEKQLVAGELDERTVQVDVAAQGNAGIQMFGPGGLEGLDMNLKEMMPGLFQGKNEPKMMTVAEARETLQREEEERRLDPERISRDAIGRVEQAGILFIDELDKVAGKQMGQGPEVSREGVQRDLLPIVEGTLVKTKYGMVRTDHILFIAAGAFHVSKPSDLIPELQGRLPIRVELDALGQEELVRILTEPHASLVRQYTALMETEGVTLVFTDDGVAAVAQAAAEVNRRTENIGARRLHTVMERLLDEVSFAGPELAGQRIVVDEGYVHQRLDEIAGDDDLSRFIL
jgi:ATP-dependent HslUV protease ATP-binding subunit HslU